MRSPTILALLTSLSAVVLVTCAQKPHQEWSEASPDIEVLAHCLEVDGAIAVRFEITNLMSEGIEIGSDLPWVNRRSLHLVAVEERDETKSLKRVFFGDVFLDPPREPLPPGATLSGQFFLSSYFPELEARLESEQVVFFWAYSLKYWRGGEEASSRVFGGMTLQKAPAKPCQTSMRSRSSPKQTTLGRASGGPDQTTIGWGIGLLVRESPVEQPAKRRA